MLHGWRHLVVRFIHSFVSQKTETLQCVGLVRPQKHMDSTAAVAIGAGAGAVVAVVGAPVVLGAIGFTSAGIAAGSYAAGMMSAAAVANGGAVAAGSTVAVLQAAGAAGLSGAAAAAVTAVGAAVGWLANLIRKKKSS